MRLKCEIKRDPFLPILNFFRNLTAHTLKGKKTRKEGGEGKKEGKKEAREGEAGQIY